MPPIPVQVQDADLEPMLGPSEVETMLTAYADNLGQEFATLDDESANFWGRIDGDYEGP